MIIILDLLVGAWFYSSAREVGKNKTLWFCIGLFTCLVLGLLFLKFGELYILPAQNSISDAWRDRDLKFYLEIASMILILGYAYMVQNLFLNKKKSLKQS